MIRHAHLVAGLAWLALVTASLAQPPTPTLEPLVRTADLNLGQAQEVTLCNGKRVTIQLLELQEPRDSLRDAVASASHTRPATRCTGCIRMGLPNCAGAVAGTVRLYAEPM